LVEWSGTADVVTSDIVASWAATPTLVANASFVSVPSDFAIDGTWKQFTVTADLSQTMNNLMMFIWTPVAAAQNSDIYITQAQIVRGETPKPWPKTSISIEEDLYECLRFYEIGRIYGRYDFNPT